MTEVVDALALLCTVAGLVAGLVVLGARRDGLLALLVALDFWTAAGLLRLAGPPSWQRLAAAATIPALRQLLKLSLRSSRSNGPRTPNGRSRRPHHALRPAWTRDLR